MSSRSSVVQWLVIILDNLYGYRRPVTAITHVKRVTSGKDWWKVPVISMFVYMLQPWTAASTTAAKFVVHKQCKETRSKDGAICAIGRIRPILNRYHCWCMQWKTCRQTTELLRLECIPSCILQIYMCILRSGPGVRLTSAACFSLCRCPTEQSQWTWTRTMLIRPWFQSVESASVHSRPSCGRDCNSCQPAPLQEVVYHCMVGVKFTNVQWKLPWKPYLWIANSEWKSVSTRCLVVFVAKPYHSLREHRPIHCGLQFWTWYNNNGQ